MKKDEIYFLDRENMKNLGIEDGFLHKKSQYLPLRLESKKTMKRKSGDIIRYKWLYMVIPDAFVDFCEHDVKVEGEEWYENCFTTPVDKAHIAIIANENFMYDQMEIEEIQKGLL